MPAGIRRQSSFYSALGGSSTSSMIREIFPKIIIEENPKNILECSGAGTNGGASIFWLKTLYLDPAAFPGLSELNGRIMAESQETRHCSSCRRPECGNTRTHRKPCLPRVLQEGATWRQRCGEDARNCTISIPCASTTFANGRLRSKKSSIYERCVNSKSERKGGKHG